MAKVELVIKIDEEQFKFIKQSITFDAIKNYPALLYDICEHIANGIPLPKGHGELIDKNKLAHKMVIEDVNRFKGEPEALAGLFLRMCDKEEPIIEADRENEDAGELKVRDVSGRKAGTPREDYEPEYDCEDWIP